MRRSLSVALVALLAPLQALAMNQASVPSKFSIPWGNSAGSAYIRSIPTPSQIGIQNCAASLTDGFPPLTFVPASAGGCPPFGQDFNGILKQLSQWGQWQSAGNAILYDSAFQSAIGGYPKWAVLGSGASPGCFYVSSVDGNATNPNTGGAGWINTCAVGGVLTGTLPNPGLAATGVGPGSYTAANITVGADGRLTSAGSSAACPAPNIIRFTSGSAQTYNPTAGAVRLYIRMVGGGGGGGGGGTNGSNGGQTSFQNWIALGGSGNPGQPGGNAGAGGTNGSNGTLIVRMAGNAGGPAGVASSGAVSTGGFGGGSFFGGSGAAPYPPATAQPGAPGSGAGGSGGGRSATGSPGFGGGGSGEYLEFYYTPGSALYTVGVGGTGGTAGGTGNVGSDGGSGIIIIEERFC